MQDGLPIESLLEQFRPYAVDPAAYGRLHADLNDLFNASEWFVSVVKQHLGKVLTPSELENLLVDIDVKFVQHAVYHLQTLKKDITDTLANFPNSDKPD